MVRKPRVYVGRLGSHVTRADIEAAFSQCGTISQIWLAKNPAGFAFVEFETIDEAERACEMVNILKEALNCNDLIIEITKRTRDGDEDDDEDNDY